MVPRARARTGRHWYRARAHGRDAIGTARARTDETPLVPRHTKTHKVLTSSRQRSSRGGEARAWSVQEGDARARQVVAATVVSVSAVHAMVGGARLGKE